MDTPPDEQGSDGLPAQHLRAFADGVSRTLQIARALVEADREVDVSGIENTVGLLCARVLDLPPELGRSLRARLAGLRDDADALSAALAARATAPAWLLPGKRP